MLILNCCNFFLTCLSLPFSFSSNYLPYCGIREWFYYMKIESSHPSLKSFSTSSLPKTKIRLFPIAFFPTSPSPNCFLDGILTCLSRHGLWPTCWGFLVPTAAPQTLKDMTFSSVLLVQTSVPGLLDVILCVFLQVVKTFLRAGSCVSFASLSFVFSTSEDREKTGIFPVLSSLGFVIWKIISYKCLSEWVGGTIWCVTVFPI